MDARRGDEGDWPSIRQDLVEHFQSHKSSRWDPAFATARIPAGSDPSRTRGDFSRPCRRSIAARDGSSAETITFDAEPIARNGGSERYRAARAEAHAWKQALRPKPCKLGLQPQLRNAVAAKLGLEWSPQQIAGWLKRAHPQNEVLRVSHETIYRNLYVQTRGVLKKQLLEHLRTRRAIRHSRHATMKGKHLGQIPEAVSIAEHLPRSTTAPCLGTGKATSYADRRTASSSPWSNDTRAM